MSENQGEKTELRIKKSLEDSLVLGVLELAAQLTKNGNKITEPVGITTQQWLIMLYVGKDPNIPRFEQEQNHEEVFASDIAEALNVSKPNITNLVNSLTSKGLIEQSKNPQDRRRKILEITPKGKEVLEAIETKRTQANEKLLADLSYRERQNLLHYLLACLEKLK